MNKRLKEFKRSRLIQKIRFSNRSGSYVNHIRVFKNNTRDHEFKKFEICWELILNGYEILTESIFTNGSRADIVGIKEGRGIIIEVLKSETEKQLAEKIKKYPTEFEIFSIKTNEEFKMELIE